MRKFPPGLRARTISKWNEVARGEQLRGTQPHDIDRLFFGHCRMEPAWDRFDFGVDVSDVYEQKMAAIRVYESVFSGDQASLLDKYSTEDRYVGSLVGVQYAEFRARTATRGQFGNLPENKIRTTGQQKREGRLY